MICQGKECAQTCYPIILHGQLAAEMSSLEAACALGDSVQMQLKNV